MKLIPNIRIELHKNRLWRTTTHVLKGFVTSLHFSIDYTVFIASKRKQFMFDIVSFYLFYLWLLLVYIYDDESTNIEAPPITSSLPQTTTHEK